MNLALPISGSAPGTPPPRAADRLASPPRATWANAFLLVALLLASAFAGAAIATRLTRERMLAAALHPEQLPDRLLSRLADDLALDAAQQAAVAQIVRDWNAAFVSLQAIAQPQRVAGFRALQADVSAALTPEQRRKWSEFCMSAEQRYLAPPFVQGGPDQFLQRFDRDQDGAIRADEAPPWVWSRLGTLDRDGSGAVDRNELQLRGF